MLLDVLLLEPGTVEREAPTSSSPVGPGRGAEISKVRLTIPGPGPGPRIYRDRHVDWWRPPNSPLIPTGALWWAPGAIQTYAKHRTTWDGSTGYVPIIMIFLPAAARDQRNVDSPSAAVRGAAGGLIYR